MYKAQFTSYMAKQHNINKVAAQRIINIFAVSVSDVLMKAKDIFLTSFGKLDKTKIAAREDYTG